MIIWFFRLTQLLKYGWGDALKVSRKHNVSRLAVYSDLIKCFFRYRLRSLQYVKDDFWAMDKEERVTKGGEYKQKNTKTDDWTKDCFENRRFLNKWKDYRWELSGSRYHKRLMAYTNRYHLGEGCIVHHDVVLERNHGQNGTISIGNNVILGKHLYIDYTGNVVIEDGVKLTNGVIIESHHHDWLACQKGKEVCIPSSIRICENTLIGSRSIILDSCHYIGKNVLIGAGSVVTKDIPDNAVAAGVPAKVIKFINDNNEERNTGL